MKSHSTLTKINVTYMHYYVKQIEMNIDNIILYQKNELKLLFVQIIY